MKVENTAAATETPATAAKTETPRKRIWSGHILEAFVEVQGYMSRIVNAPNPRAEVDRLRPLICHSDGRIPFLYFYVAHSEMARREVMAGVPPETRH